VPLLEWCCGVVLVYFRVVETFGAGLSPSDGVGTACSRAEVLLAQPDLILAALVPRASRAGRPSPAWARPVPGPEPAGVWLSAKAWTGLAREQHARSTRSEAG